MKLFKIGFFSCIATFLKVQYGYSNPFNKNNTCHLYGILDIELSFMEEEDACCLELRGIFTAASNEKLEIPGFYNSDYSNALNSLERNNYCFFACVYANYLEQNTS